MAELWYMVRNYLNSASVIPSDSKMSCENCDLITFAAGLRNGVILCNLSNFLMPNSIKDIKISTKMSEFMCIKNIKKFLGVCISDFDLSPTKLFEPNDLYYFANFRKVLELLVELSHSKVNKKAQLKPIPIELLTKTPSVSYDQLVDVVQDFEDDDDIYEVKENKESADDSDIYQSVIYQSEVKIEPKGVAVVAVVAKNLTKSDYILKEIIDTEKAYTEALLFLIKSYMQQMLKIITNEELSILFINIEDIYKFHEVFVKELDKTIDSGKNFAEVFDKHKEGFYIYAEYCVKVALAQEFASKLEAKEPSKSFLNKICSSSKNKYTLSALLCLPFQRILRYSMLIKEYYKNILDEKIDKNLIKSVLDFFDDFCRHLNTSKKDDEIVKVMNEIQNSLKSTERIPKLIEYGKLIKDGEVMVKFETDKKPVKLHLFLFEKLLMFCKSSGENNQIKELLDMKLVTIVEESNTSNKKQFTWVINSKENSKNIVLSVKSSEIMVRWIFSLKSVIENYSFEIANKNKHSFELKNFTKITHCIVCKKILWGTISQGFSCMRHGCETYVHINCVSTASFCSQSIKLKMAIQMGNFSNTVEEQPFDMKLDKCSDDITEENKSRSASSSTISKVVPEKKIATVERSISCREKQRPIISSIPVSNSNDTEDIYSKLTRYDWFVRTITRAQANSMLVNQCNGCFLVRGSENASGQFVICIVYKNETRHIKINFDSKGYSIAPVRSFESIPILIEFYQWNSLVDSFPNLPTILTRSINSKPYKVIAKYTFLSKDQGQLSIKKNCTIDVYRKSGCWLLGELDGNIGYFPENHVQKLEEG